MEAHKKRPAPPITPDLFRQEHITIIVKPDTQIEEKLFALLQIATRRADRLQARVDRLENQKRSSIAWTKVRKLSRLKPSPMESQEQ